MIGLILSGECQREHIWPAHRWVIMCESFISLKIIKNHACDWFIVVNIISNIIQLSGVYSLGDEFICYLSLIDIIKWCQVYLVKGRFYKHWPWFRGNGNKKQPEDKEITADRWNIILFEKAFRNWIQDLQNKSKWKTVRLVKEIPECVKAERSSSKMLTRVVRNIWTENWFIYYKWKEKEMRKREKVSEGSELMGIEGRQSAKA